MRKILFILLIIAILFVSSGQTYEQQSLLPTLESWLPGKPLEGLLSKFEIPYWGHTVSVDERGYFAFIEFILRKGAHFVIFGLLAVAIYAALPKYRYRMLMAFGLTLVFAIGDEFHQFLTGGRTPSSQDVLLDMSGAVVFIILFKLLRIRRPKKRKKPRKSK